jgi:hypothetical protein
VACGVAGILVRFLHFSFVITGFGRWMWNWWTTKTLREIWQFMIKEECHGLCFVVLGEWKYY